MKTRTSLISRIDKHLADKSISATRFCHDAKVDHHVIPRLRRGESISLRSIERLEKIMDPLSFLENEAENRVSRNA